MLIKMAKESDEEEQNEMECKLCSLLDKEPIYKFTKNGENMYLCKNHLATSNIDEILSETNKEK